MSHQLPEAQLRRQLGDAHVDAFLGAAGLVGRSYLSGDEDLVFGFIQRVLAHLRNQGTSYGLIFPKFDQAYRRLFDYFDGEGRIFVIYPGCDGPDMLCIDSAWVVPMGDYYEVPEAQAPNIMLAFLAVYAHLRFNHTGDVSELREASPRPDNQG
jgi:hypothetical protein